MKKQAAYGSWADPASVPKSGSPPKITTADTLLKMEKAQTMDQQQSATPPQQGMTVTAAAFLDELRKIAEEDDWWDVTNPMSPMHPANPMNEWFHNSEGDEPEEPAPISLKKKASEEVQPPPDPAAGKVTWPKFKQLMKNVAITAPAAGIGAGLGHLAGEALRDSPSGQRFLGTRWAGGAAPVVGAVALSGGAMMLRNLLDEMSHEKIRKADAAARERQGAASAR